MGGHVQELTKRSGYTADARTLGGFQSIRWKILDVVTDIGAIEAYHVQGINYYSVDMRASRFVGHLRNFVYNVRPETEFRNPSHHTSGIVNCVNE